MVVWSIVFAFESNARSNMIEAMHYCIATVFWRSWYFRNCISDFKQNLSLNFKAVKKRMGIREGAYKRFQRYSLCYFLYCVIGTWAFVLWLLILLLLFKLYLYIINTYTLACTIHDEIEKRQGGKSGEKKVDALRYKLAPNLRGFAKCKASVCLLLRHPVFSNNHTSLWHLFPQGQRLTRFQK